MITPAGFSRPTSAQILTDVQSAFKTSFTQIIDGVEFSPSLIPEDFLGALSVILANLKDSLYQDAEKIYYSKFLTTAEGVSLDRAASPKSRFPAKFSATILEFLGDPDVLITTDKLFETENHIQFHLVNPVKLNYEGFATGVAIAVIAGTSGNVPVNSVTFIVRPINGLDTVTNILPAEGGQEIETDANFRARAINENALGITSSLPSIISAVRDVANVLYVTGYENITETFDAFGLPPGAVNIVVRGGTDEEIANAIFSRQPAGNPTFGDITITVADISGIPKTISFDRVVLINLYVRIVLMVDETFEADTEISTIKKQILKYIGGVTPDDEELTGLGVHETAYAWKTQATLFEVDARTLLPGILNAEAFLGLASNDTFDSIETCGRKEKFVCDFSFIEVIVNLS